MAAGESLNPIKILVIDDNSDNLYLMTFLLRAEGYHPLIAVDGIQGLDVAKLELPDLVLCDIHMPFKTGYDVAYEFVEDPTLRNIPLVAITSYAMVGDRERILGAGFDAYISKPIDPETFVQEVLTFYHSYKQSISQGP